MISVLLAEDMHMIRAALSALLRLEPDIDVVAAATAYGASPLTLREATVLREAAHGAPADEIARRLHLSTGTVRNYLTGAITRTGARNTIDAIRIAQDAGWI